MGEIRLKIPDKLHRDLKRQAALKEKRLPDYITFILRNAVNRSEAER